MISLFETAEEVNAVAVNTVTVIITVRKSDNTLFEVEFIILPP